MIIYSKHSFIFYASICSAVNQEKLSKYFLYIYIQVVVAHSTLTLRAKKLCKARHGFTQLTQEVASNLFDNWRIRYNFLRRFCEAMSGFVKLLNP